MLLSAAPAVAGKTAQLSTVPTENSISVKKGEVKQLRKAYSSVASSVMASPAAKTATCQLLGLAESCPRRSSARLFQHYIKERQGLRLPGVRSGDSAHQPGATPRLSPCAPAGSIAVRASPCLGRDAVSIGDSNPNTNEGYDGESFRRTRARGPGTRAESNQ